MRQRHALPLSFRFQRYRSNMAGATSSLGGSSPPLDAGGDDTTITPWSVEAKGPKGIDYGRVLVKFKAQMMDESVTSKLESVLKARAQHLQEEPTLLHHFFTRGIVFSHRDFDKALVNVGKMITPGQCKAYLYTGRGPSARSMHIGHMVPFLLTKYLQDALGLPLVIQITDDEKYLFRDMPLSGDKAEEVVRNNIKDVLAFGFNPRNTFIFRNTHYMGEMYTTVLPLQRAMTLSTVKNTFGFSESDSIGKVAFAATQAAPCFSSAFRRLFHNIDHPMECIVPCAIDQDPFFLLTRNIAPRLKQRPPALLHTQFLPALKGPTHKMSSSAEANGIISLHDTDEEIRKKLRRAFSGGSGTMEEMRCKGADLDVDVAYQIIRFFCTDTELFNEVTRKYSSGQMNSGEVKDIAGDVLLRDALPSWRERRAQMTDEHVDHISSIRNINL